MHDPNNTPSDGLVSLCLIVVVVCVLAALSALINMGAS